MTKIKKKDEGLTLKIDKTIVDTLGINEDTDLDMVVMNDMLIIKAKDKSILKKQQEKRQGVNDHLMDKYESVLKKLAKT